jgi:ferredoxin
METSGKKLLVCNCAETMPLDAARLGKACGQSVHVHRELCRSELANVEAAAKAGAPCVVCCTQEAPLFDETFAEHGAETTVAYVNIRERAGWSDEAAAAMPKIAALIAEAGLDIPPTRSLTLQSEGRALIYGRDDVAVEAARQLAGRLDATVLLTGPAEVIPPAINDTPLFAGTVNRLDGHLGAFAATVDGFAAARPSSRAHLEFEAGKDGIALNFDVVIDLTGGEPLIPAPEKRDGYFHPDPGNPALVQKALYEAADLVGEFDKPIYVTFFENLCAHSRSTVTGCTRCLDVCPASAIAPAGDHVAIDAHVCGGCGACASVCPTGAASYAVPSNEVLLQRLRTLLGAYREAGGSDPVLLMHDVRFGNEAIGMMSRFGRGLPARVLPFAVNEVTQLGLDVILAAMAFGAARIVVFADPARRDERTGLEEQITYADAALAGLGYGTGRVAIIDEADPEAVAAHLYGLEDVAAIPAGGFLAMGGKREITALALRHLHDHAPDAADTVALPTGAPFGAVTLDVAGCTLCLSCVGACPTGALKDNPDAPMLRFAEEACIQCGLCRNTCPESVITLTPRFNFTDDARREVLLKEEEPFNCIACGKPFGARSSVEKTIERLAGHSMFADDPKALERLRMCEECRVLAQFTVDQPMAAGTRRITRTTDDYLAEREQEEREEEKDGE